jgi:hypothetical protein
MSFIETIKSGGELYRNVGRHKCVQYTLENIITAELVLLHKKGIEEESLQEKENEGT